MLASQQSKHQRNYPSINSSYSSILICSINEQKRNSGISISSRKRSTSRANPDSHRVYQLPNIYLPKRPTLYAVKDPPYKAKCSCRSNKSINSYVGRTSISPSRKMLYASPRRMRLIKNKNTLSEKVYLGCRKYSGDIYAQLNMKRNESLQLLPILKILSKHRLSLLGAVYIYDTFAIL